MNIDKFTVTLRKLSLKIEEHFEAVEDVIEVLKKNYTKYFPNGLNNFYMEVDVSSKLMSFGEFLISSKEEHSTLVRTRVTELISKAITEDIPSLLKEEKFSSVKPTFGLKALDVYPFDNEKGETDYEVMEFLENMEEYRWSFSKYLEEELTNDDYILYKIYIDNTIQHVTKSFNYLNTAFGEVSNEKVFERLNVHIESDSKLLKNTLDYFDDLKKVNETLDELVKEMFYQLVDHPDLEEYEKYIDEFFK